MIKINYMHMRSCHNETLYYVQSIYTNKSILKTCLKKSKKRHTMEKEVQLVVTTQFPARNPNFRDRLISKGPSGKQ